MQTLSAAEIDHVYSTLATAIAAQSTESRERFYAILCLQLASQCESQERALEAIDQAKRLAN